MAWLNAISMGIGIAGTAVIIWGALLALLEDGRLGEGPTLYWHTYNALSQPLPQPEPDDYRRLPRAFHRFFETEA